MELPRNPRVALQQSNDDRLAALGAARRFIQRRLDILLESVCGTDWEGKPDLDTMDQHAVPDVRSYKRILTRLDNALGKQSQQRRRPR